VIPIILLLATVLVTYGLVLFLRAVAQGQGRRWLRLFRQAWRSA